MGTTISSFDRGSGPDKAFAPTNEILSQRYVRSGFISLEVIAFVSLSQSQTLFLHLVCV